MSQYSHLTSGERDRLWAAQTSEVGQSLLSFGNESVFASAQP